MALDVVQIGAAQAGVQKMALICEALKDRHSVFKIGVRDFIEQNLINKENPTKAFITEMQNVFTLLKTHNFDIAAKTFAPHIINKDVANVRSGAITALKGALKDRSIGEEVANAHTVYTDAKTANIEYRNICETVEWFKIAFLALKGGTKIEWAIYKDIPGEETITPKTDNFDDGLDGDDPKDTKGTRVQPKVINGFGTDIIFPDFEKT